MTFRELRIRRLLGAALALAVFSSCGGGGNEAQGPETVTVVTTQGATTEAGATEPSLSEDQAEALAASMNLRLTDFPAGWRATPSEESEGCAGIQKLTERYDVLAHVDSKDFAKGDNTEASSSAGLFNDEATARDALNYLESAAQSEELRDCLNDFFREQAEGDVTFGDVSVGQLSFPRLGDRSSAWEIVVPVKTQGLSVTAYIDFVYIVEENALARVAFSDVLSPFDEQLRENLARLVADRMQTATGA
jgi:hypothetical protein